MGHVWFDWSTTNGTGVATDPEPEEFDESEQVEAWRLKQLLDAGFSTPLAEILLSSKVDVHRAVTLVEHGCEHTMAADILL